VADGIDPSDASAVKVTVQTKLESRPLISRVCEAVPTAWAAVVNRESGIENNNRAKSKA
jgi:hypothetical protein